LHEKQNLIAVFSQTVQHFHLFFNCARSLQRWLGKTNIETWIEDWNLLNGVINLLPDVSQSTGDVCIELAEG
jgi:hypothetical protein